MSKSRALSKRSIEGGNRAVIEESGESNQLLRSFQNEKNKKAFEGINDSLEVKNYEKRWLKIGISHLCSKAYN